MVVCWEDMEEVCEWNLGTRAELSTSLHVAPHSAGAEKERGKEACGPGTPFVFFLGPPELIVLPGAAVTSLRSALSLVHLCLCFWV